jgi:hypothetical protein
MQDINNTRRGFIHCSHLTGTYRNASRNSTNPEGNLLSISFGSTKKTQFVRFVRQGGYEDTDTFLDSDFIVPCDRK